MSFIPDTPDDTKKMLEHIGASDMETLFAEIPKSIRFNQDLNIKSFEDECALSHHGQDQAEQDHIMCSFVGAGAYDHFIPAAIWQQVSRGEWLTAYTPYQAEASQGALQMIYEYQSMMCSLLDMEVSNASMYDGSSALVEAIFMAARIHKSKNPRVTIFGTLSPAYRQVLDTFLPLQSIAYQVLPIENYSDTQQALAAIDPESNIYVLQQPCFLGQIQNWQPYMEKAQTQSACTIALVNPLAMAYLEPPGRWGKNEEGVDIVCGEAQSLGVPLSFGGPYLGFLACKKKHVRQIPGRIVGKSKDRHHNTAYCLTLQAREQHIRRGKATSNICTNQGLLVCAASMYMRLYGTAKMRQAILNAHHKAQILMASLGDIKGIKILSKGPVLYEWLIQLPSDAQSCIDTLAQDHNIVLGLALDASITQKDNTVLMAVTEKTRHQDMQKLLNALSDYLQVPAPTLQEAPRKDTINGIKARSDEHAIAQSGELQVVRHYTRLSQRNFSIDTHFYPLGSCTMKYNPRSVHQLAMHPNWLHRHPYTPAQASQGLLSCLWHLQQDLCSLTGMHQAALCSMAGAQGEFAGCAMIRAYHHKNGEPERNEMIVPDAAHGTNPATAAMCNMVIKEIPTDQDGNVDLVALKNALSEKTAGMMLTNPSTLGVFEQHITTITKMVHEAGGLMYYDGANFNAIMGQTRPGDMGFDVMHLNLHKTFATPHGGGGPGAGPVLANKKLAAFLPIDQVGYNKPHYSIISAKDRPDSIGRLTSFFGNVGVLLRAYFYIKSYGGQGLIKVSQQAVLKANYLKHALEKIGYYIPYSHRVAQHEFVLSLEPLTKKYGIKAVDFAKALIDYGIHPPTMYFPLIVPECFLIEPTETESKETLDRFIKVMEILYQKIIDDSAHFLDAPHKALVKKVDETLAARELDIKAPLSSLCD